MVCLKREKERERNVIFDKRKKSTKAQESSQSQDHVLP